jgi:hypothetical protein
VTIDHQKEDLIEQAKKRMISNIYLSISTKNLVNLDHFQFYIKIKSLCYKDHRDP